MVVSSRLAVFERTQAMDDERDFLDEIVEERTEKNSEFPRMVDAAARRRKLIRTLAEQRERSQTAVAAEMGSSQSAVARLERATGDPQVSTIERYALAVGYEIEYHLVPVGSRHANEGVVVHG